MIKSVRKKKQILQNRKTKLYLISNAQAVLCARYIFNHFHISKTFDVCCTGRKNDSDCDIIMEEEAFSKVFGGSCCSSNLLSSWGGSCQYVARF